MNDYVKLFEIYYTTLINVLNNYPYSEIGIRKRNGNSFYCDIKIPNFEHKDQSDIFISNNSKINNLEIKIEELNFDDFISKLDITNQYIHKKLINKYLLFDKYFKYINDEFCYINNIELIIMIMNNNYSENIFKKCLLDNIHYSFYNIHEFISGKDFIDKMYNPCNNLNLEIYSTFLFINLHGLITDLKVSDNNKINAIIKYQKIKSYKRYKRNKEIEINSIDKVIEHYRDAVCHVESHNNKITDSFDGNNFKLLISGIGNEPKISYGGGSLSINDNLIPLIKEIKKIFIPNKIRVISIYGRENRLLFCDVLNHDDNFPIVGKVEINKLTNDMFRFNFPFIK